MNRPLSPQKPSPDAREVSLDGGARLLREFAHLLGDAERELDAVDFEELAAAVEDRLEVGQREVWEERLARDPELTRRAAELARFRAVLDAPRPVHVLPFRRPMTRPGLMFTAGAAAATLLVALLLHFAAPQPSRLRAQRAHRSATADRPCPVHGRLRERQYRALERHDGWPSRLSRCGRRRGPSRLSFP